MRLYSALSEETLRARTLLRDWASDGFLTEAQYQRLEKETVVDLRTTNFFLRLLLFLFTLIIVGAAVGLLFVVFLPRPSPQSTGVILLIVAAVCYAAAEFAVSQARLHRYGIEEALTVCSTGFLCVGMKLALFSSPDSLMPGGMASLVPASGAISSLWLWHRFGLSYAFLAAMIFVVFLPGSWASSPSAQHLIVAAFYAAGLTIVAVLRSRRRFDYVDDGYSVTETFLWLGIYLAINLQILPLSPLGQGPGGPQPAAEFARPFYWSTWVLTWCLPPLVLARGVRRKDRSVIAVGAVIAILTFVSNKPYLGWKRHTWDPMLLGALLTGFVLFIRRWLARGPNGIRHGFTARRLSGTSKHWLNAGSALAGLLSPGSVTPSLHTSNPDVRFGGGDAGGAGATSDF